MNEQQPQRPNEPPIARRALLARLLVVVVDVALVFAVFYFHGAWPAPDTNEPHYLTKAKHFWRPDWCGRDIFLSSADSHVVFFAACGWLTTVFSLPTAAWCGRIATWLLTAWGWRRLSRVFAPRFGFAALTAAAALGLNERFEMAGEWFVGGFEAKGIAYALVFWGLADVFSGRWNRGLVVLGAASAFHVLVGGWTVVAVAGMWLVSRGNRPTLRQIMPGLIGGGLLALAGVVPGVLLGRGVDADIAARADQIHVFERLAHHLWGVNFLGKFGYRYAAMWIAWGAVCCVTPADAALRRLRRVVLFAALFALCGLAISYASREPSVWAAAVLKYYWFRLADVAPAVGLALELGAIVASVTRTWPARVAATAVLLVMGGAHLAIVYYERSEHVRVELVASNYEKQFKWVEVRDSHGPPPRGESGLPGYNYERWLDICRQIREETPHDALFIAPRPFQTFKWHAERAELCAWKDVPQDAPSLIEWRSRLDELYGDEHWVNFLDVEHIRRVCRKYGVSYVVTYQQPPLELPVLTDDNGRRVENPEFIVYELPK